MKNIFGPSRIKLTTKKDINPKKVKFVYSLESAPDINLKDVHMSKELIDTLYATIHLCLDMRKSSNTKKALAFNQVIAVRVTDLWIEIIFAKGVIKMPSIATTVYQVVSKKLSVKGKPYGWSGLIVGKLQEPRLAIGKGSKNYGINKVVYGGVNVHRRKVTITF